MAKRKTPSKPSPSKVQRRRTIDLLPEDIQLLSDLKAHYLKGSRFRDMPETQVMRIGWEDAAILNGLRPRRASSVDPIGGES